MGMRAGAPATYLLPYQSDGGVRDDVAGFGRHSARWREGGFVAAAIERLLRGMAKPQNSAAPLTLLGSIMPDRGELRWRAECFACVGYSHYERRNF